MSKSACVGNYIYSIKPIGKGAYSKVYKGFDTMTDEVIAVKIIEKFQLKKELIERLKSEVALMTRIQHDNIVEFRDFLEDDENFYLILEYCAGGDLSHRIKKGRIPEDTARDYMRQLAKALRYLKSMNIIHRDLKPQNILLDREQKVLKVTDFNFARELYDHEMTNTICGSPLYMAPEIIKKNNYSVKTDLWSVGLILYEMVYGNNPYFDAIHTVDLLEKINNRNIVYTRRVSSECNELINSLLQKDPDGRCDWQHFFKHSWLAIEEPAYISPEMDDMNNMWESINLSTLDKPQQGVTRNEPIRIASRKFHVDIVDNYIPFGITPPQNTRSEPIVMYNVRQSSDYQKNSGLHISGQARSAPESRHLSDNIWSYMSGSVNILKGAVDYISFTASSGNNSVHK